MILGLDISSNKTGVAILDLNGNLVYFNCIDTQTNTKAKEEQFQDLFAKVDYIVEWLKDNILAKYNITQIHIEEPLSKFTPGRSSMHTLQTLFKVNYVVSYEMRKLTGVDPHYWNPNTVVSMNCLKIPRGGNKKQIVYSYIKNWFPSYREAVESELTTKKLRKGTKVKTTDFSDTSPWLDISDAISIANAGYRNKSNN